MNKPSSVYLSTRPNTCSRRLELGLGMLVAASFILCGNVARADDPTNQLHFAFTDASGTTTPSDTSLNASAIVTSLTMYNAASPAVAIDLHGAVGSGVTNIGVASTSRALDFTADIIPTQTNQPANSKSAVVANGSAETGTPPASGSGNA